MRRFADYALCCFGLEVGKKIAPGHFDSAWELLIAESGCG
jgi:hypothetical protein